MSVIIPSLRSGRVAKVAGRLVSAEFLKVRKRRGPAARAALLMAGAVAVAVAVRAVLRAQNPAKSGPAASAVPCLSPWRSPSSRARR